MVKQSVWLVCVCVSSRQYIFQPSSLIPSRSDCKVKFMDQTLRSQKETRTLSKWLVRPRVRLSYHAGGRSFRAVGVDQWSLYDP